MASLNTAWAISLSALAADQTALATVANNTANASTPGYTEESAVWQQAPPIGTLDNRVSPGIPDGVLNPSVVSQRDRVLDQSIDVQSQAQAATAARLGALENLASVFATATSTGSTTAATSSGIGMGLGNFYGALQQLEALPANLGLRQGVLGAANTLAATFNAASASLAGQQQTLNGSVSSIVTQANGLLTALATVNAQIQSGSPDKDAGTLEDQRQQDLASLAQLLGSQQATTERNGLTLSTVSGVPLVEGNAATSLTTSSVGGVTHIFAGTTDITTAVMAGGGQAGGLLTAASVDIPAALSSIDTLAYQFATAVNTVNQGGSDLNGNAGTAIFTLPASSAGAAGSIAVAITNPAQIAAAAAGAGPADGTNAAAMAALASTANVGGATGAQSYASFVSLLGSQVNAVAATNTAQQASITQLTSQQTALSGVSLNAEATSLENMEQAFQAASKVFTIIDQLVAQAINLGTETTVS